MNTILIMVPALNEAENLGPFLERLKPVAKEVGADIAGLNDGSTDETEAVFRRHGLITLSHIAHMGYGTTLQTGYKFALRKGYRAVVQIDGDGQHDPRFIRHLLRPIQQGQADVVIGSRFTDRGVHAIEPEGDLYRGTFARRIGIHVFRALLRLLCFRYISDPTSGYIALNRKAIQFFSGKSFPFDYPDADIVLTLIRNGFRVFETPVYMYKNGSKQGKLHRGCQPVWYIFKVTLSLFVTSLRPREFDHG